MEEEKLRELISVQELLDDEDDEAFNVCTKEGKDIMMLCFIEFIFTCISMNMFLIFLKF